MYDLVSYVCRGSVRRKVIRALLKPNSPTGLARQLDMERSTVSRTIQDLVEAGLVECLTPDQKMGRFYRVTDTGRMVIGMMDGKVP